MMANTKLNFFDARVFCRFVQKLGEIIEMRILKATGKLNGLPIRNVTVNGYFDNHADFLTALNALKTLLFSGAYFSLQVIDPRLIGRAFNRLKVSDVTTSDKDVLAYRWLPLDFDPVRPAGISSSDAELKAALELRDKVTPIIKERFGLPEPMLAMSGNGGHALFRLPDWPADAEHIAIMKNMLANISKEFSTLEVNIDTSVFNPARIWKLYGTAAHKGDAVSAGEYRDARPHRESYIEKLGE